MPNCPHANAQLARRLPPDWRGGETTVFARFAAMARRAPDRVAIREGDRAVTYEELHTNALHLASSIESRDGSPLGLCLPAGADLVAVMLAALRQGRPYVPLAPTQPKLLRDAIVRDAGIREIIGAEAMPHRLNAPVPPERANPDSVACVIYTSGSTGQPKGVYQNQRILRHDIRSYGEAIRIQSADVMTWLYPSVTGGAIRDVFGALLHGAELVVMDPAKLGLRGIAETVRQRAVTIFHAIPPLLREFLAAAPPATDLSTVRMLYLAGDRFFRSDFEHIYHCFPRESLVYTGLGATECTTLHRHWVVSSTTKIETDLVPVGFDVPDKTTRLLDEEGRAVKDGEIGEIEVSSAFLALGYWNQPEATRERFMPDPADPQRRVFRTGDLGRLLPDGNLQFIGRKDGMVKIRGYRVETAAVEAALRGLSGIHDVAVLVREDPEPELVALIVATPSAANEPESLRSHSVRAALTARLPSAAIPATIVWRDQLPRLASYKLDRRELQNSAREEDAVATAWRQALAPSARPDPEVAFADAGGTSLGLMRLHVALEKWAGHSLPAGLLHARQTLRGLRAAMQEHLQKSDDTPDPRPVWFVIGGIAWSVPHLEDVARDYATQVRLHPVSLTEIAAKGRLSVPDLGAHVAAVILETQKTHGDSVPMGLLGVSLGALIAHEAACLLQEKGIALSGLIAFDLGPGSPQLNASLTYRVRKAWRSVRRGERRFTVAWAVGALLNFLLPASWLTRFTCRAAAASAQADDHAFNMMNRLVFRSLSSWPPRFYRGSLTLMKPTEGLGRDPAAPPDFGWGRYAAHVLIHPLPGGHTELFAPKQRAHLIHQMIAK